VGPKAGVILPKGEGATCWGWLYPDKILAMTKGKLAYEFRRSLPLNDIRNDPSSATAATGRADCNHDGPPPFAAAHLGGVRRSWLGQLKRSAQLFQKRRHVVVIGDPGDSALPENNDRGTTKMGGPAGRSHLAIWSRCRPRLSALDDPFRRGDIADGRERPPSRAKVGSRGKSTAYQLFDLGRSAGNVAACDILVHRIVSENRVNPLRLVKRPSRVHFIKELVDLFIRHREAHASSVAPRNEQISGGCETSAGLLGSIFISMFPPAQPVLGSACRDVSAHTAGIRYRG
jgi:hypothetical protein